MARRSARTPMAVTIIGLVAALLLASVTGASAAEPLPTGTYEVTVGDQGVGVTVGEDGTVAVTGAEELVVELAYDDDGRVLDRFTVTVGETVHVVEITVAEDGTYTTTVTDQAAETGEDGDDIDDDADGDEELEEDDESDLDDDLGPLGSDEEDDAAEEDDDLDDDEAGDGGEHGAIVSTVATCAPRGLVARQTGWPNHGTIVRAAAQGTALEAEVTDPDSGETTPIDADFSSVEGAEAFCAMVADTVPTAEEVRAERAEARAAAKAERGQDRDAAKADREQARAEARADREQARADRGQDRAEAKADRKRGGDR